MGRLLPFKIKTRGVDKAFASFVSMNEAMNNTHCDETIDIVTIGDRMTWGGVTLATYSSKSAGRYIILTLTPAPGMILFIGWLMTILPSRATVTWRDGWPHVHCPPHDDRDHEDDPTPLVPNELVPA